MNMPDIPFGTTDWNDVPREEHRGTAGTSWWRVRHFGGIRVRMVENTPGYRADHWCDKGHILLCLEGEHHTELKDGRIMVLTAGMSYQVGDNVMAHRSFTPSGSKLFIVD